MDKMDAPGYPSVAGQAQPDLNLADGVRTPKTSLIGGNFADSIPVQNLGVPALQGDASNINMMGIDPHTNYFDLELASPHGAPNPSDLMQPAGSALNLPTFGEQNYDVPPAKDFDLTGPGIDAIPPLQPDPHVSDLLQFGQPHGLTMFPASQVPMMPDPNSPDFGLYDRPDGLDMPGILMVDPLHPDLQHPDLTQAVHMPERPGDLDGSAMSIMHDAGTYRQLPTDNLNELWMQQNGNNQRRERHVGMLMLGLDSEE